MVVARNEPVRIFRLKYLNVAIAARTIADLFGDRVELGGEANWDGGSGDDYTIAGLDTIEDSYGEGGSGSGSNNNRSGNRNNRSNRSNSGYSNNQSRSGSNKESAEENKIELTPGRLALLDNQGGDNSGLQAVPEAVVRKATRRTTAPIYVTVNRMHNLLLVRTSDEKAMEEIEKVVRDSDHQVPEVLLEMKVLEIKLTDQFQSAFDIGRIAGSRETGPDDGHGINPLNSAATAVGSSLLGVGNFSTIPGSTLTFQYLSNDLRVRLQLLQQNNNISALATPMLLAANNHPARLFIGEEAVLTTGFRTLESTTTDTGGVVVRNAYPIPETEVKSVGNTLTILPSINADRSVVMRIVHENSSLNLNGGRIPLPVGTTVQNVPIDTITTSKLEGTVLAQDGMTVAIGGMMRTEITDNETKVPILGDIPGLGFFFKKKFKNKTKTELVLLITPHVLTAPTQGEEVTRRRMGDLSEKREQILSYIEQMEHDRTIAEAVRKVNNTEKSGYDLTGAGNAALGVHDDLNSEIAAVNVNDGDATENPADRLKQNFIELIKTATMQVRIPAAKRQPVGSIRPTLTPPSKELALFKSANVAARPVAAWSDGRYFVTALKVINRTNQEQTLSMEDISGRWAAVTLEEQRLTPAGQQGDTTWLYLVSTSAFETAVSAWLP
jgi:general secretion pathway protein D